MSPLNNTMEPIIVHIYVQRSSMMCMSLRMAIVWMDATYSVTLLWVRLYKSKTCYPWIFSRKGKQQALMLTNLKEKQEKRKSHYCSFFFPLLFCRLMHGLVTHYLSWKCNYYIVQPTTNYNCRKRNYYFFWVHNKHSICRKVNMNHLYIDM